MIVAEAPTRAGGRWTIRNGAGCERCNVDDGRQVRAAAKALGVAEAEVRAAVDLAKAAATVPEPVAAPSRVIARPEGGTGVAGSWPTLGEALTAVAGGPPMFLEWTGDAVAALDVDLRPGARPFSDLELEQVCDSPGPRPRWAWLSRSGGLRLVYEADGAAGYGLTASQRAGLATFVGAEVLLDSERVAKVELLTRSRDPRGAKLHERVTAYGSELRGRFLGVPDETAATPEEVERVLAARGLQMGGRYGHAACPFDPRPVTSDATGPVHVVTGGVRCYVCDSTASYGALSGGRTLVAVDPLVAAADARAHWGHVRWLMRARYGPADRKLRRAIYSGLLRVVRDPTLDADEEKAREKRVWDPELHGLYRSSGAWCWEASHLPAALDAAALAYLPAVGAHPIRRARAATSERLPGYLPVIAIPHVVTRPTWRDAENGPEVLIRRMVPRESLGRVADADAVLRQLLPGVTDAWLRALRGIVAGALLGLGGGVVPPLSLLLGPTGSGKGALIGCAAGALAGASARAAIRWGQALDESIGEGLEAGACLLVHDEAGKAAKVWENSAAILRLSQHHTWRKLYTGTVRTDVRAHVVLAGSTLPRGLTSMPEFERRAAVWRLPPALPQGTSNGWAASIEKSIGSPAFEAMRTASEAGAQLANAIVDDARRELEALTAAGVSGWPALAATWGAEAIHEDEDAEEVATVAHALYDLWTKGPGEIICRGEGRWDGWIRGWFAGPDGSPGQAAARILADYLDLDGQPSTLAARVAQLETYAGLADYAGADHGLTLAVRSRGRRVAVRVIAAVDRRSIERKNRAVFPRRMEV